MAGSTIKSYTVPSGKTGEGAHWSFEWTSAKKYAGVSTVSWNLYTRGRYDTNTGTWFKTGCELSVGYNGTTKELYNKTFGSTNSVDSSCSFKDKYRASGTFDVTHEPNGYASFTVYFNVRIYTSAWYETQGLGVLDNLPTKATITTATSFDNKHNPVVGYSNPAGTSVSSLDIAICATEDGTNPIIPYTAMGKTDEKYYFELTDSQFSKLCNLITSGDSTTVYFCVRTVIDGATYYDYKSATFSLADADPVVRGTVVDVNPTTIALTGDANVLVKYCSNAKATMTTEPQDGAAIYLDTCIIRNGSESGYGESHTFNNIESNVFTFSAEDSRGNVGTDTVTPTMIEYIKPTCNFGNNKPDGNGDMNVSCSGNFFNDSFGEVSNSVTAQYRYKESGGEYSAWSNMTVTYENNYYAAKADLTGLDYKKTYFFQARVKDALDTWVDSTEKKTVSKPAFHWGDNDFVFEVPVEFRAGIVDEEEGATGNKTIDGDLTVKGNLRLKGDGNYGNTLFFGDGSYAYITEPEDDCLYVKCKKIDFDANSVNVYGYPIPVLEKGIWSPTLNSSAVSSYTTNYGWYSKMGQTVCAGFFIKANCASGQSSMDLKIYGLPFTPLYSAAGGGMCSGAYVSGGFNFQCFVAEGQDATNAGLITTRVQSCNHTAQTNLSTSASGCKYPNGGGEVTLSGTIIFMANS